MNILPSNTPQNKPYYTYILAYPESMGGSVFYIGKGGGYRIDEHERDARRGIKSYKCSIIRKIWAQDEQIVKQKVAFFDTHEEACLLEVALIFLMRPYGHLANMTDGGDGTWGWKHTEEELQKMSESQKGRRQPEEHRQKNRESHIGRKHSEERNRKMSGIRKGRTQSEESRRQISESLQGHVVSEETRHKQSEAQKRRPPISEDTRRKLSESHKKKDR